MGKHDELLDKGTGILGLGGSTVPKEPGDPTAANDAASKQKRRQRMEEGEAEANAGGGEDNFGAIAIDMGAGGHGTGLSGK